MPLTSKLYYCPTCGNEEIHPTNHYGEIYSPCRKCKSTVLYCREAEPGVPDAHALITFFSFNLDPNNPDCKETDLETYRSLCIALRGKDYKRFESIATLMKWEAMRKYDGTIIDLFHYRQFDNQYVSSIGRVFQWFECHWPNHDVRDGYFLTVTPVDLAE